MYDYFIYSHCIKLGIRTDPLRPDQTFHFRDVSVKRNFTVFCSCFFKLRLITYSHRIPINYLLDNLAVADIIYPIFSIPKTILRHTFTPPPPPEGVNGKVLCTLLTVGKSRGSEQVHPSSLWLPSPWNAIML